MRNVPVDFSSYEMFVTAKPEQAEFMDKETGELVKMFTKEEEERPIFRLSVFAKNQNENRFGRLDAGEEIEVQVPGLDTNVVRKGSFVQMVNLTMSPEAKLTKSGKAFLSLRWNAEAAIPVDV